jgi:hypothetical protein
LSALHTLYAWKHKFEAEGPAGLQDNHAGDGTCADAEAARQQANETARPWARRGPTPAEVWERRRPVAAAERTAFVSAVGQAERAAWRAQGYAANAILDRTAQAAANRVALKEVLLALGLLRLL